MTKPQPGDVYISIRDGNTFIVVAIDNDRIRVRREYEQEHEAWELNPMTLHPEHGWYRKVTKLDKALR